MPTDTSPSGPAGRPGLRRGLVIAGSVFGLIVVGGTATRLVARKDLHAETVANAVPTVTVVHPAGSSAESLVLPGRLQAWSQASVYARTSGYLRQWYADIGQPVRAGQTLADIETPEVDQQLVAARAALATADAQRSLAQTTVQRWDRMIAEHAVSQQDADERRGDFAARNAMRAEAAANVRRLQEITGFKRVTAPFAGVVTSRTTDVGALIVSGAAGSQPLFTVADVSRLRIYVSVPQSYAGNVAVGMTAHFKVPDRPGKTFEARLVRSADAVDPVTGAILVQFAFANGGVGLKAGGYAEVTFDLPATSKATALKIPASSLLFRRGGTEIAVVDRNGRVAIRKIAIQRDLGTELEVAGLNATDWVVDGPSDAIATGDRVRPAQRRKTDA